MGRFRAISGSILCGFVCLCPFSLAENFWAKCDHGGQAHGLLIVITFFAKMKNQTSIVVLCVYLREVGKKRRIFYCE